MQRVTLITIGKLKEQWAKEAAQMYLDRIHRAYDFMVLELPPSRQPHASGQMAEESDRLLTSARKQQGHVWALDERGEQMTSQQFSDALSTLRDRGESVTFLLGGAYGLSDAVRNEADGVLSLGSITMPHDLCRIVFLEQLYRAAEIRKGSGYHH